LQKHDKENEIADEMKQILEAYRSRSTVHYPNFVSFNAGCLNRGWIVKGVFAKRCDRSHIWTTFT